MKLRYFILISILATSQIVFSQDWNPVDSVKLALKNTPTIPLSFDKRNSFISGNATRIWGIKAGVDYGKVALLGAFYTASLNENNQNTFDYTYISAIGEYHWYQSYRFRLYQSIQLGVGVADEKIGNDYNTHMIFPLETGVSVNVRLLKYFGLYCGLGARWSMDGVSQFSAPYYTYGIKLLTRDLVRDIKKGTLF